MTAPELHPEIDDDEKAELLERGVELFNAGEHFEAHECFEEIWRSTNPEPRDLFQGLVQTAAGLHHWLVNGRSAPAARVLARGMARLESLPPRSRGLDLEGLLEELDGWTAYLDDPRGPAPPLPRIVGGRRPIGSDEDLAEEPVSCPWCGEAIEVSVDPSGDRRQEYVEDCPVCCRPFVVEVDLDGAPGSRVDLRCEE